MTRPKAPTASGFIFRSGASSGRPPFACQRRRHFSDSEMIQEFPDIVEKALERLRAGDDLPWRKWLIFVVLICTMGAVSARAATQTMTYDAQGNLIASVNSAVVVPPTIVAQPVDRLAQLGSQVSFSVVASGSPTLGFQWRLNGNPISIMANPSAGAATLVLSSVAAGDFGTYSVVVTNSANSATSNPAALQLDSVGDGVPDSWKLANFGANWQSNPNSAANADPDVDDLTNAEEYSDGTDPNNAASHFYRLTVAAGTVALQPAAPRYASGSVVTLTALPVGDLQFTTWSTQDLIANTTVTSAL